MELDFSKLNNIKSDFIGSPTTDFKEDYNTELLPENKTAVESNIKPLGDIETLDNIGFDGTMYGSAGEAIKAPKETPKKYLKIKRDKEDREKARKAYEEYQKNILKSEMLRSEINKDIYNGVDPYNILLKAIECIGLMTSDTLLYTSNIDKLKEIYGALGNTKAIEQELQEVTTRLERLKEAQQKETSENIRQAIIRQTQKREELIKLLNM